jgi:type IV secretion system protein VirB11
MTLHKIKEKSHDALDHSLLPIEKYITDKSITEVCINQPHSIHIERWEGWEHIEIPELTLDQLSKLANLIAVFNNKSINSTKPILTASLPDGQRVQVVMPPVAKEGTISFTIRIPSSVNKSLDQLEEEGSFVECKDIKNELQPFEHELIKLKQCKKIKEFLKLAVTSRRNIIIAGETGSGKTTIAKSLIEYIPREERLITLESEHEIDLANFPNKVNLLYSREDNGGIMITPKQCLAACLRMNPSRILLAEILGDESWDFIKSINTGHAGSITTMHANGAYEAIEQMVSLVKDSPTGAHLDSDYVKRRLLSTIDIVLFFSHRQLQSIYFDPTKKHEYLD